MQACTPFTPPVLLCFAGWCKISILEPPILIILFGLQVLLIQVMVITREFLVMSRHNLIPGWFAYVNPYTGTPLRIVIPFGIAKGTWPFFTMCWSTGQTSGY